MAGAPKGNKNAAKGKDWEQALRRALHNYEDPEVKRGQSLDAIAKRVVKNAVTEGEWKAIEEIGNRLDGKPAQSMELSGHVEGKTPIDLTPEELDERIARLSAGEADSTASTH